MEIVRQKNVATYITFPIVDADGDFVTGATGLDSEIDQWSDGSAPTGFADCTNEATEIGTTGVYYLSLTQTEMNDDYIVIQVKTTSSGAKTQLILIRTMVGDPLNFAVTDDGTAINVASGIVEAQVKSIDNNAITAASIATGAIDADAIAADAITAAKIAADAGTEIGTAVWATTTRALTILDEDSTTLDLDATIRAAIGMSSANLDTQLTAIDDYLDSEIAAIKAKTDLLVALIGESTQVGSTGNDTTHIHLNLDGTYADDDLNDRLITIYDQSAGELHSRWITDFVGATALATVDTLPFTPQSGVDTYYLTTIRRDVVANAAAIRAAIGLATANLDTQLTAIDDYLDTEVAAIKAKTDQLTFGTANRVDAQVFGIENNAITANSIAADAIGSSELAASAVSEIADQVWEEAIADHSGTVGSTAEALDSAGGGASPSAIADAVWDEVQSGHTTSGTFGAYLDAAVSAAGAVAIQNPGGRGQGMTPAQADDIAKRTWNVEVAEGKTAKQVLLEAAMPEEDKPGYDDTAMKDVMTQMAKMLGDMSSKDTTAPVLEALANLDKPADYTQNFESMGKRFDEVMAAVGAVMPNLVEFADRVNSVGADMSDANAAIQETLDKIHVLDGDFAELQGLVDAFKDKLEEQVDMDKRVAALGGKLNDKALTELSNKITDMQRMLLAKIENTKFDILKSL